MQVCTSLQTDNHASTPPLSFLQAGCPSCHPTNSVTALKARMLLNYKNACTEFYLEIQYLLTLTEKLQSHFFTVTETRNSDK